MKVNANVKAIGDYGNPTGTGAGRLALHDLPFSANETADAQTAVQTFFAALRTQDLTGTVAGDIGILTMSENFPAKPEQGINVDRLLVVTWRTKSDSSVHRLSIPGVPATSSAIDALPEGDRLSEVGKVTLAASIATLYNVPAAPADGVIILSARVYQKK